MNDMTYPYPDDAKQPESPLPFFTWPNGEIVGGEGGFTKLQRACIDLRVPDSDLPWLNHLIRESRRLDKQGLNPPPRW